MTDDARTNRILDRLSTLIGDHEGMADDVSLNRILDRLPPLLRDVKKRRSLPPASAVNCLSSTGDSNPNSCEQRNNNVLLQGILIDHLDASRKLPGCPSTPESELNGARTTESIKDAKKLPIDPSTPHQDIVSFEDAGCHEGFTADLCLHGPHDVAGDNGYDRPDNEAADKLASKATATEGDGTSDAPGGHQDISNYGGPGDEAADQLASTMTATKGDGTSDAPGGHQDITSYEGPADEAPDKLASKATATKNNGASDAPGGHQDIRNYEGPDDEASEELPSKVAATKGDGTSDAPGGHQDIRNYGRPDDEASDESATKATKATSASKVGGETQSPAILLPTIPAIDSESLYDNVEAGLLNEELQNGEQPKRELPPLEELDIGQTVLMPVRSDGQRFRATILQRVDEHKNSLDKERLANAHYQVLVGHEDSNKWEEVVAYNRLVNFIEDTAAADGQWRFKEILHHDGPLTKASPNYKRSRWNVHVLWETGEISIEPLSIIQHAKVVCALYAQKHGLLNEPGWTQFRKVASEKGQGEGAGGINVPEGHQDINNHDGPDDEAADESATTATASSIYISTTEAVEDRQSHTHSPNDTRIDASDRDDSSKPNRLKSSRSRTKRSRSENEPVRRSRRKDAASTKGRKGIDDSYNDSLWCLH
jgi:hypothetical protein